MAVKNTMHSRYFLNARFKQSQTHPVPRQCFFPIPGIDSVLVQMERLTKPFLYQQEDRTLDTKEFSPKEESK
jgi:16S rRNA A1518/A1519 N6-dimethyltransferase RsmA/KsgA/DIM1 with predicted DNA glycosylase/AP lyase activity